ncbi:SseB family protein [Streptococcus sp. E29BA]|uniref:SseB family protein n=1 Tax=Streptococcus sp. E29BA TaxID=3278716 RepID=UPI00359E2660
MKIKLTKELDKRLRAFIADPTNFLDALGLVNAFHGETVLASDKPYAIEVEGQKVVPVFTDVADLNQFKALQASANQQKWVDRSALDVLREAIEKQLAGLVFNLKKSGDGGNSTLIKTSDMITFVNHHTQVLNRVLGEENQVADKLDKTYLIPAYHRKDEDGNLVRIFTMMTNPEGQHYVPVFSNLVSFARWYNDENFGGFFRQQEGVIMVWELSRFNTPPAGKNILDETTGIAINPFDEGMELLLWEQLEPKA